MRLSMGYPKWSIPPIARGAASFGAMLSDGGWITYY